MSEILKSPCGKIQVFSKRDLRYFASCVYLSLRYHGNPRVWWTRDWPLYTKQSTIRAGAPHLWKRIHIKEEDDDTIRQPKRIKHEEKEVIDLTNEE
jgi:hypothetical protein